MRNLLSISLCFLFLFSFFSVGARAYLPVDINLSTVIAQGDSVKGVHCLNSSADSKIYCYIVNSDSGTGVYGIVRYNATWQDPVSCEVNQTYAQSVSAFFNESYAVLAGSGVCDLINITALNGAGGSCPQIGRSTSALSCKSSAYKLGSGYSTANYLYFPHVIIGPSLLSVQTPYYPTTAASGALIMIPSQAVNTTLYYSPVTASTYMQGLFTKYVNEVNTTTIGSISTMWGINTGQQSGMSMITSGTTTWLYVVQGNAPGFPGDNLYRVNFTKAEGSGQGTSIYLVTDDTIPNATVNSTSGQMAVALMTACNGTLTWYFDGASIGTTAITTAPFLSAYNEYFFSTGLLSDGPHRYQVNYTDDCGGTVWSTETRYFTKGTTGAVGIITDSFSSALGVSAENGRAIFAMILSVAFSAGLAYYVGTKIFVPSMMGFVLIFAFVGWFPAWMTLIFIVIAGVIFSKMVNLT